MLIKNSRGVAILMVLTSVTILSFVLAEFTFDTFVNKLKVLNVQDKTQARLNAESGLQLSLARLKFYQEARNLLEKNEEQKKTFKHQLLNYIWSTPFVYPIPLRDDLNILQRTAIEEFLENTILQGSLSVTIQSASNLLNLNMLRLNSLNILQQQNNRSNSNNSTDDQDQDEPNPNPEDNPLANIEKKLIEILTKAIEEKKENDELFELKYSEINPAVLIKTIKYYINPKGDNDRDIWADDPDISEVSALFESAELEPKGAPLNSLSEIYTLPGWDDQILDLIKREITVHGNFSIDLNKITLNLLKLIFPEIDDEVAKEFFNFRDNPDNPHFFNDVSDLKKWAVSNGVTDEESFDELMKEFQKAGLQFGGSSNIFKVISNGQSNRASYTLTGWAILPVKPPPPPEKPLTTNDEDGEPVVSEPENTNVDENDPDQSNQTGTATNKKRALQFLEPRFIEILAN